MAKIQIECYKCGDVFTTTPSGSLYCNRCCPALVFNRVVDRHLATLPDLSDVNDKPGHGLKVLKK